MGLREHLRCNRSKGARERRREPKAIKRTTIEARRYHYIVERKPPAGARRTREIRRTIIMDRS